MSKLKTKRHPWGIAVDALQWYRMDGTVTPNQAHKARECMCYVNEHEIVSSERKILEIVAMATPVIADRERLLESIQEIK